MNTLNANQVAELQQAGTLLRASVTKQIRRHGRLMGFVGVIQIGELTGQEVFFPQSQVGCRNITNEEFVGQGITGVVTGQGRNGNLVLSERQATKAEFDKIDLGHRLRMVVTTIFGSEIHMLQSWTRGLPFHGTLTDLNGRPAPKEGDELWVVVTGKTGYEEALEAGGLLLKAEEPSV